MNDRTDSVPVAGISFQWQHIAGYYLMVRRFVPFAKVSGAGDTIGSPFLGSYGIIEADLPNPDVTAKERRISLPIEHKSDFKSVYRTHLDGGVNSGANEVIVLYEHRRGLFNRRKPCLHVACHPAGTWQGFFQAVDKYASAEFVWPEPLFLYSPTAAAPFPSPSKGLNPNIFSR